MRSPVRSLAIFAGKFARDRRGATAAIFALALVPIIGLMGFAIDVGNVIRVKHAVQAATDAAALAGAYSITNNTNDVAARAMAYSSASGGSNTIPNITVSANVTLKCFLTTGASCAGVSNSNGLVVVQTATVPTYFTKIFGINSFSVSATATAGSAGSKPVPLNVMILLDATGSMGDPDPNCGGGSATKLNCALAGVQSLLGVLAPSVDQVGLMVFPAFTSATAATATDCNKNTNPTAVAYSASNLTYQVVAPAQNYRGSDTAATLASGTPLVSAAGGGCSGNGIQPITGGGIDTFFADAIWQAQTQLVATDQTSTTQNVIVFLSDGNSNSTHVLNSSCPTNSSSWCIGSEQNNQCHAAIRAAKAAAAAGTWMFSIAYASSTLATGSCSTDTPLHISACSTMTQIASDPSKFYSDSSTSVTSACPSTTGSFQDLLAIFTAIGHALQQPRLFANNTT